MDVLSLETRNVMNNIKETANIKETSNNIGFMMDCYASFLLKTLPETLSRENLHSFLKVFNSIESVTEYGYETAKKFGDDVLECGAERMLVPFHHLTWSWENAYTRDFTWEAFLDSMLESGDTVVQIYNKTFDECGDTSKRMRVVFGDGSRENAYVEYGFPD